MNPLATLLLITYNQKNYISEALKSLVNQNYENYEIVISDDASTDGTQEEILRLVNSYKKTHPLINIKYNFNIKNLDIGGNISEGFKFCNGDFIIPCAGDDISQPDRCSKIMNAWVTSNCTTDYIYSDVYDVSVDNEILCYREAMDFEKFNSIEKWFNNFPIYVGAGTWSKNFFIEFNDLYNSTGEDQILSFRAMLNGKAHHIKEPLVRHRVGGITGYRALTVDEKLERMLKDSLRGLNDIKKIINDAKKFNLEEFAIEKTLHRKSSYQLHVDVINSPSRLRAFLFVFNATQVPLGKKIRLLIYKLFPLIPSIGLYLRKLTSKKNSSIKF